MAVSLLERRSFRKIRVRKKISGTPLRPRLSVYRSLNHIYAQLIDDSAGRTIVSASSSSLGSEIEKSKPAKNDGGKKGLAFLVGQAIAKKALAKNIKNAVFDRGGNIYHGRIQALAEGARDGGLEF